MTDAWYEAYVSGDDRREGDEYAEEEVEDVADDEPMRVAGRIFIGSIDAARNVDAMKRLRIGAALALLGRGEERAAVSSRSSCVEEQYAELGITRTTVQIEDSKEGDLLRRLPGILAALEKLV
ncbi:unnamed protein product [Phytophthora lilii]|uniref:Unnamed protein product n=1 Tax=Phytophthora lilii TaxID=2077276 RepID=A0A9W6WXB7_9STRA|nr:unnamed protein product [Phytophthora lilii]